MNTEIDALKRKESLLLDALLDICDKYQLRYFLLGGSCLGAVRHKGFIPWDDDIDVGMPRPDYERFLEIAPEELPDNIFVQTAKTDPAYPMNFAKLRDSSTTFIESSVKDFPINHGIYLDIFPLDGFRASRLGRLKNKLYSLRMACEYTLPEIKTPCHKRLLKKILKIIYKDYKTVRDRRDNLLQRNHFDDCEIVANFCGAWGEKEIMPKTFFGKGTLAEFEGRAVVIPEQYDAYLTQMYGKYMEVPPAEKRVSHHYCEVIDTDSPYTKYLQNR